MICPYCGGPAVWVDNSAIYGRRYGKSHMVYLCRPCNAWVGCHHNSRRPLGTIANKELREWRHAAHLVIDRFWQGGGYKRSTVYKRLSEAFGHEIHIAEADVEKCKEIIETATLVFNADRG